MPNIFDIGIAEEKPKKGSASKTVNINDIGVADQTKPVPKYEEPGFFEKLDTKTTGPTRAVLGSLQRGEDLGTALKRGGAQFRSGKILPSTPTGEQLTSKVIESHPIASKLDPESKKVLEFIGGFGINTLGDPLTYSPTGILKAGGEALYSTGKYLAKSVNKGILAALEAAEKGTFGVGDYIIKKGASYTQGNVEIGPTKKALRELSPTELFKPGNKEIGFVKEAGETIGKLREEFRKNPVYLPQQETIQELAKIKNTLLAQSQRTLSAPKAKQLINKIDLVIGAPDKKITLAEIDDLVGNFDELLFTAGGNEKQLRRLWGPTLAKMRQSANQVFQLTPEGQAFQKAKDYYSNLQTAATRRSKLVEQASAVGALGFAGAAGTAAITGDEEGFGKITAALLSPFAIASRLSSPRGWMQLLATIKVPSSVSKSAYEGVVAVLQKAKQTGSIVEIRDATAAMMVKHPEITERIVRATLLESAKSDFGILGKEGEAKGLLPPDAQQGVQIPARSRRYLQQLKPQENIRFPGTNF